MGVELQLMNFGGSTIHPIEFWRGGAFAKVSLVLLYTEGLGSWLYILNTRNLLHRH